MLYMLTSKKEEDEENQAEQEVKLERQLSRESWGRLLLAKQKMEMEAVSSAGVNEALSSQALHSQIPKEPVSSKRAAGTLQHQGGLPKMPIPALADVLEWYLSYTLPFLTPEQQKETQARVAKFSEKEGPELYAKLHEYDAKTDNYLEHFYREGYTGYSGSLFDLNPSFVLFPTEGCSTAATQAAAIASGCLQHYFAVREGSFPPSKTRSGFLCMRQMPWVHATARICTPDAIDDTVNAIDTSKHIVAICGGHFYKIQVVADNGSLIASNDLLVKRFEEVIAHAKSQSAENSGLGALTCGARSVWEAARARLSAHAGNKASFDAIDTALGMFALDGVSALDAEAMQRNLIYGLPSTVSNRWMDKSTVIVCEDGQAGLNWEHSVLDGHTMMEFFAQVAKPGYTEGVPVVDDVAATAVQPIALALDADAKSAIASATKEANTTSQACAIEMLEYTEFGSTFIKGNKNSPDGFVQAALQITFYRLYNRLPVGYESVLAKAYKYGRVTVGRNMSELIKDSLMKFASSPDDDYKGRNEAFRAIVGDIGRCCRNAAGCKEWDRPVLAMRGLAKQLGLPEPSLCQGDAWSHIGAQDLCTSHCGKPPIRFFGYIPPSAKGFSVGYYVDAGRIQFSITNYNKEEAKKFKAELASTLTMLKNMCEKAVA